MISFNLFKIKVQVSFAFTVFITLLAVLDNTGLLFISFLAILFHEIGHILAIQGLGVKDIKLMLVLGSVRIETKGYLSDKSSAVVSLFGPLVNLILSAFIFFKNYYLAYFGAANLIVFIFNMLPINGLDGGDILKHVLKCIFHRKSDSIFKTISLIFTISFTAICGTFFAIKYFNPTLLIVGIYLIIMSIKKV